MREISGHFDYRDVKYSTVSDKDIPCIHQIIDVALHHGSSVREIVNKLEDALEGAYSPRGYNANDLDIATLIFRLGGRQLLFTMNQILGVPSLRTLRSKSTFTSITPTPHAFMHR
jgi:hypothetical protein